MSSGSVAAARIYCMDCTKAALGLFDVYRKVEISCTGDSGMREKASVCTKLIGQDFKMTMERAVHFRGTHHLQR